MTMKAELAAGGMATSLSPFCSSAVAPLFPPLTPLIARGETRVVFDARYFLALPTRDRAEREDDADAIS